MLDLHRLIGFVWYSHSPVTFRQMKDSLRHVTQSLDEEDVTVVLGERYNGAAESAAAIANSKRLLNDEDFVNMTKATIKAIGAADLESPKLMFVLSDDFTSEMEHTINKMRKLNETYPFPVQLHFIQVSSTALCMSGQGQRTILSTLDDVTAEVSRLLEEANVVE